MLLRGIDSIDASPHSAQKLKVGLLFEASSAVAATTAGKGTGSDKQGHALAHLTFLFVSMNRKPACLTPQTLNP